MADLVLREALRRMLTVFDVPGSDGLPGAERETLAFAHKALAGGHVGELLTGGQVMDEMDAYCAVIGNGWVAKALRDGYEGRGRPNDKGHMVHAVRHSLKIEEVRMYRRTEPKVTPPSKDSANG